MGKKAKFPARGSTVRVKLAPDAPERGPDESELLFAERMRIFEALSEVELEIELRSREDSIKWNHSLDMWHATESKRRKDLEASGAPVPSGFSADGIKELRAIHYEIVKAAIRRVHGIEVGERDLATVTESELLACLLDDAGLLADCARRVREVQTPTPRQSES